MMLSEKKDVKKRRRQNQTKTGKKKEILKFDEFISVTNIE